MFAAGQERGRALGAARARGVAPRRSARSTSRRSAVTAAGHRGGQARHVVHVGGDDRRVVARVLAVDPDAAQPQLPRRDHVVAPAHRGVDPVRARRRRCAPRRLEVAERRLVAAHLLGGHDEVDRDAERGAGGLEQVVVAVGQDAELPALPLQLLERRRRVRERLDRVPPVDEQVAVDRRAGARAARAGTRAGSSLYDAVGSSRCDLGLDRVERRARARRSARRPPARGCAGTRIASPAACRSSRTSSNACSIVDN